MTHLEFDFSKATGKIKAMHAVGQPPRLGTSHEHLHWLSDAHIPYSRLHDVGGAYGGYVYVDIPNIFRDMGANENDPASYDFAFTDNLIDGLIKAGCEPIYRLGVTIENYINIKSYRLYPPSDYGKWARICEHIIRHYNEGWANGFYHNITYWEIWNEPDNGETTSNNQMWQGTPTQYFELYETTSKHLKKRFGDKIKIGGFASCGFSGIFKDPEKYGVNLPKRGEASARERHFIDFALDFLDYVKETSSPLDFFSWHSYASVSDTEEMADFVDRELTKRGMGHIETQLNEWNNAAKVELRGTSCASARAAAMMIAMQYKKTDILCYYDARIGQSVYGGLFNPMTYQPLCTYYSFKAFGELYMLGTQAEVAYDKGTGLYALAATNGSGKAALIANVGDEIEISTNLSGMKVKIIDSDHFLTDTYLDCGKFVLGKNQVALIQNY
jgi:xylan 1,4-beta-xylosidase